MIQNIVQYVFEIFQLKRVKHTGWQLAHVENPDSVAEHVLLAAQIGYLLAELEGADKDKVLRILVFHDNAETRIGDLHKIAQWYVADKVEIETAALCDQTQFLPKKIMTDLRSDFVETEKKESLEAKVVKDADYLEQAFQARLYQMQGHQGVKNWIENIAKALKTDSAKKILAEMIETDPMEWAVRLKKTV
jgi:putative hydrolase of HD superfamily